MTPVFMPVLALSLPVVLAWAAWRFAHGFARRRYPEGDWARWALPGITYNAVFQIMAVVGQGLAPNGGDALRYAETMVVISAGIFALVAARDGAAFPLAAGTGLTPAAASVLKALFCLPWIFASDLLAIRAPWEAWLHFALIVGAGIAIHGGRSGLRATVLLAVSLGLWAGSAQSGLATPVSTPPNPVSELPEAVSRPSAALSRPALSHAALRREQVVMQSSPATCGPAAVATLLNFYGLPVTEADVLNAIPEFADTPRGFSMDMLLQALLRLGAAEAGGYRFSALPALRAYQERVRIPVIVHLKEPTLHFSVLVGTVNDAYVLADPAWGLRVLSEEEMAAYWSGAVLIALPDDPASLDAARASMARIHSQLAQRVRLARLALGW